MTTQLGVWDAYSSRHMPKYLTMHLHTWVPAYPVPAYIHGRRHLYKCISANVFTCASVYPYAFLATDLYICTHAQIYRYTSMYQYMWTHRNIHTSTLVHMHLHTCRATCANALPHNHGHMYPYLYTPTHISAWLYISMYTSATISMPVHLYVYIYTYVYGCTSEYPQLYTSTNLYACV